MPVQKQYIVLFIVSSLQEGISFSIIDATISAIRYSHSILGYQVGKSNMVKHILEAAKRILAHPVDKKLAFTVKDLRSAVGILDDNKLKDVRTKVIMLLSFAGFLRFSECQNLRRSDIQIFQDYAMIFIEKSKTDIYRNEYWLFLARLNSVLCPIRNLQDYLEKAQIDAYSNEFIFRSIKSRKKQEDTLRDKDEHSYTRQVRPYLSMCLLSLERNKKTH